MKISCINQEHGKTLDLYDRIPLKFVNQMTIRTKTSSIRLRKRTQALIVKQNNVCDTCGGNMLSQNEGKEK